MTARDQSGALPDVGVLMEWGSERDGITVRRCSPHVFHTRPRGRLVGDVMERFVALLDRLVAAGVRGMVFFHDFSSVESYEPSMRQRLTEWRRNSPPGTTRRLHVLVRSKIVAMGVSGSAIVLRVVGIELDSYSDRAAFERALERAVGEDTRR